MRGICARDLDTFIFGFQVWNSDNLGARRCYDVFVLRTRLLRGHVRRRLPENELLDCFKFVQRCQRAVAEREIWYIGSELRAHSQFGNLCRSSSLVLPVVSNEFQSGAQVIPHSAHTSWPHPSKAQPKSSSERSRMNGSCIGKKGVFIWIPTARLERPQATARQIIS